MPKFILTGDIIYAGRVVAEGATAEEAIANAEAGKFTVYEKVEGSSLGAGPTFSFDGGDDHIEREDGEEDEEEEEEP